MSATRQPPKPPRGRPRTGARVAAVQALFQSEQSGETPETVLDQFIRHRLGAGGSTGGFEEGVVPEADAKLFTAIVRGAGKKGDDLDAAIRPLLAKDWTLEKLDPVLRALLRAAAAELIEPREPPARVVINEYLDVAAGFLDAESTRFANGVLDALAHHLRPAEFGARA
jgi:N utilization substance protein B